MPLKLNRQSVLTGLCQGKSPFINGAIIWNNSELSLQIQTTDCYNF